MFGRLDATLSYVRPGSQCKLVFRLRTRSCASVFNASSRDVVPIAALPAGDCWTCVLMVSFGKSFEHSLTADMPLLVTDDVPGGLLYVV